MSADFVAATETAGSGTAATEAAGSGVTGSGVTGTVKGAFYRVGAVEDFALGKPRSVEIAGRVITIVRTEGGVFAFGASCPHQGGPLCAGSIHGTMLPSDPDEYVYGQDGDVIRCPWHGYEFSIRTGESIAGAARGQVPVYQVDVRDDVVYASLTRIRRGAS